MKCWAHFVSDPNLVLCPARWFLRSAFQPHVAGRAALMKVLVAEPSAHAASLAHRGTAGLPRSPAAAAELGPLLVHCSHHGAGLSALRGAGGGAATANIPPPSKCLS